jgi:hypothetical protein
MDVNCAQLGNVKKVVLAHNTTANISFQAVVQRNMEPSAALKHRKSNPLTPLSCMIQDSCMDMSTLKRQSLSA